MAHDKYSKNVPGKIESYAEYFDADFPQTLRVNTKPVHIATHGEYDYRSRLEGVRKPNGLSAKRPQHMPMEHFMFDTLQNLGKTRK